MPGSHFFSSSIDGFSRVSWTQHVADLTPLNHIFVSLLTDLADEGLPVGQELEGFGAFFGIKFLKPLFFGGRGCHIDDNQEDVSEK